MIPGHGDNPERAGLESDFNIHEDHDMDQTSVEPSVQEYARSHALTVDYRSEDLLRGLPVCEETAENGCKSPSIPEPDGPMSSALQEPLDICLQAIQMLQDVTKQQVNPGIEINEVIPHSRAALRFELPLLSTDNELDLLCFGTCTDPKLSSESIQHIAVKEDHDEGLSWPSYYHSMSDTTLTHIRNDKLEIGTEAVKLLFEAVNVSGHCQDMSDEQLSTRPRVAIPPISLWPFGC